MKPPRQQHLPWRVVLLFAIVPTFYRGDTYPALEEDPLKCPPRLDADGKTYTVGR